MSHWTEVAILAGGVGVLLAAAFVTRWVSEHSIRKLRAQGLLPPEGQATMDHVREQVARGERVLAMRLYREIHRCSLLEAKQAVERLERGEP